MLGMCVGIAQRIHAVLSVLASYSNRANEEKKCTSMNMEAFFCEQQPRPPDACQVASRNGEPAKHTGERGYEYLRLLLPC